ncbi:tRNA adenosine(34) deaminase TadA [Rossellomorea marisflavi]|uniref:tRNA adenosine(34) deaminase TadA n=1 Tax=Rossellomorea marisflavi TaxID=189381 RepID=UPI001EE29255|nr:tRNA adenosine(34) deaminase TadA [Rossellomorea marisflavi]UKS65385.1 tRNA adenosine(34) deaminase TadA [Rossellomorea marisflavi]
MTRDERFMIEALKEAGKAAAIQEVPIGAVVVLGDEIIGRGHNLRETTQNAVTHAEMLAIQEACERIGTWRLEGAELYVTLEPCPMCSGAIILSRVEKVIYGAKDPKAGCVGTLMNLLDDERFNHQCVVVPGVMEQECGGMLSSFFKDLRARKKAERKFK